MDPATTLDQLRTAVAADERDDALEHAENLRTWLQRGGFVPANYPGSRFDLLSSLSAVWSWATLGARPVPFIATGVAL